MKQKPTLHTLFLFLLFAATSASAFYDPGTQRWLTRDPLAEEGGLHLYRFCANAPAQTIDAQGLSVWKCTRTTEMGAGRHAYLWDDRPGPRNHSCGMGASDGRPGPTSRPSDGGPIVINPPIDAPVGYLLPPVRLPPWQDGDYLCKELPGTSGYEDQIMAHCRDCINSKVKTYVWDGDCHTACDAVLRDLGIEPPDLPRIGTGKEPEILPILF